MNSSFRYRHQIQILDLLARSSIADLPSRFGGHEDDELLKLISLHVPNVQDLSMQDFSQSGRMRKSLKNGAHYCR
jgi:hypothetical protein